MKSVVVGLSGGVDSAVAALLLKEQGCKVTAVMGLFSDMENEEIQIQQAKMVCEQLRIPMILKELKDEFKRDVVDYFTSEYKKGRTPSPCIVCNRKIKFPLLENVRKELKYDFIATGHYAKTSLGKYPLMRGKGTDQSYFISRVDKRILLKTILPLHNLDKGQVIGKSKAVFSNIEWHSSRDICFVSKDYANLVKSYYPVTGKPGPILDTNGKRIGTHKGVAHYTVGQRKGLDTTLSVPLYVKSIIPEENKLIVSIKDDCVTSSLTAKDPIWLVNSQDGNVYNIQTYSTQAPFDAKLILKENEFKLEFTKPEFQITPGQLAVLYDNDIVVGSGWIE
jgi:tRNA-specific 2-thiouridylase